MAFVLCGLVVLYILIFLIWINWGGQDFSTLFWCEAAVYIGCWLTPVVMTPQPRPDNRESYPDDHPAMQDESWRYQ